MDELEISGKRYISTRLAGKEHNYHADYIGQLIRGGKVAGQKVGRSWYVDAESLAAYLTGEGASEKVAAPAPAPVKEKIQIKVEEPFEVVAAEEPVVVREEKIPVRRSHLMPRPLVVEEKKKIETAAEEVVDEEVPEEKPESHHVPITVMASPRLRYIEEEKPLFPATLKKNSHKVNTSVEKETRVEEVIIRPDPIPQQMRRLNVVRTGVSLVIVGCVTLVIMAALSAYVVSVTTIKGETASAGYALKAYSTSF